MNARGITEGLQLTRAAGDRRLFALGEVGTLRFHSAWRPWDKVLVTIDCGGRSWSVNAIHGRSALVFQVTDAAGAVAGEYERLFHGQKTRWAGRDVKLHADGRSYVLMAGDRRLATMTRGRSKCRLYVVVDDAAAIDPGLLLFATFLALRTFAEQDDI